MISPGNVSSLVTAWTGAIGSGSTSSSPAVVNGTAYIGSDDGTLYAFDASGTTGCSGVPKTCSPLWTARGGFVESSPAVVQGVVYVGSLSGNLYAFDASGTTGCTKIARWRTVYPLAR